MILFHSNDDISDTQMLFATYTTIGYVEGSDFLHVDESGSMEGEKAHTAKALALALAWVARRQRRWCGLVAYSDALRRLTRYATGRGWARSTWTVEAPVHFLSAVAIYVGRIHRLNSWDVARQPAAVLTQALAGFTRPLAVFGIATMFIALSLGQALSRPLLQALTGPP